MFKGKMCINNCSSLFEKVSVSIIINIYLLQVVYFCLINNVCIVQKFLKLLLAHIQSNHSCFS